MKIYTKTGDGGETGLPGGRRAMKDDVRIEACGAVDELNAAIGVARSQALPPSMDEILAAVQHHLFDLGAQLAASGKSDADEACDASGFQTARLEEAIDRHEMDLLPLRQFILPGGTAAASALHFARTVARRAERRVVAMHRHTAGATTAAVIYLNRLSDLLFVLARSANAAEGRPDVVWEPRQSPS